MDQSTKTGLAYGITAYVWWAIAPVYFKLVSDIGAMDILSHRVLWSFVIVIALILVMGKLPVLIKVLRSPKSLVALAASTALIAANWGTFIYAVNSDQMLSASLGYYINPLISIIIGMVFFKDRLDRAKQIAAALCVAAVVFEVIQFGRLPWIALALAFTFAFYGLVRKKLAVDSFTGMALETLLMLPFALMQLKWSSDPMSNMFANDFWTNVLLFAAGPVTMVPLMLFAAAANRVSLVTLGFFQYIGPSGIFLLAVFAYGETFSPSKFITFGLIWAALLVLVFSSLRSMRKPPLKTDA
ncbi:EamA family transporter RarD [Rhodanobacter aciditrophus]|uniref:EamA family transporter RarD n=1 Tax=Rhodanobacter aciditrophus TaxID=1623218 RepID=A0ABW4B3M5_9GAMM